MGGRAAIEASHNFACGHPVCFRTSSSAGHREASKMSLSRSSSLKWCAALLVFLAIMNGSACSSLDEAHVGTLPAVFHSPQEHPDFAVPVSPESIERRILKSTCGSKSADMSQLALASGYSTRPASQDDLHLESGRAPSATRWFLVRSRSNPNLTYCGVAYSPASDGTNVSVANVRARNMDVMRDAIASGDFLCKCQSMSR